MPRRKNNDIRLSVIGDIDGMTVGALRAMLDDIPDDTVIEVDEEEWPNDLSGSVDTFYHLVIRRD